MMRRAARTRGLTLIEVLVGISVLALIFFAAFSQVASSSDLPTNVLPAVAVLIHAARVKSAFPSSAARRAPPTTERPRSRRPGQERKHRPGCRTGGSPSRPRRSARWPAPSHSSLNRRRRDRGDPDRRIERRPFADPPPVGAVPAARPRLGRRSPGVGPGGRQPYPGRHMPPGAFRTRGCEHPGAAVVGRGRDGQAARER